MISFLENFFLRWRKECQFDVQKSSHILLFPGMVSHVSFLFSLTRYLRRNQADYGVTAIPLGLSMASFEKLVQRARTRIRKQLLEKADVKRLILFGHSYGGRVVCALADILSIDSPQLKISVITAGTPIMPPTRTSPVWYKKVVYFLSSSAFRNWPPVKQPEVGNGSVDKYIGFYSLADKSVPPDWAKLGFIGELKELNDFSHFDFLVGEKMGPILIKEILK